MISKKYFYFYWILTFLQLQLISLTRELRAVQFLRTRYWLNRLNIHILNCLRRRREIILRRLWRILLYRFRFFAFSLLGSIKTWLKYSFLVIISFRLSLPLILGLTAVVAFFRMIRTRLRRAFLRLIIVGWNFFSWRFCVRGYLFS